MLGPVACSVVSHERDAQPRTLNCRGNPPFMNAVCEIRKSLFFSYNIVAFFFSWLNKNHDDTLKSEPSQYRLSVKS